MPKFMSHPMAQPLLTEVEILIDKNTPAGQVGEHLASHPGRDVELIRLGSIEILPVGHKPDPIRP